MAQLRSQTTSTTQIRELTHPSSYTAEVTLASESQPVILTLYTPQHQPSTELLSKIHSLHQKYPKTKWMKMVADVCIPNYPERNVPTLLVYNGGELLKQIVGCRMFNMDGGLERTFILFPLPCLSICLFVYYL